MRHTHRCGSTKGFDVCLVMPPHMLESIAYNGDPKTAAAAKDTLLKTARLMGQRDVLAMMMPMTASPGTKQRTVFDARHYQRLPGITRLREGGEAPPEGAVREAYDGAGFTYDLLLGAFGRNSLDNNGMRLDSTIRYGRDYENAFWNGSQMVYGEGDGKLFNRFTIALDICGHELAHGLTQYACNLPYEGMSGALNESISDCVGSMVKQLVLKQTSDNADWVIGAGLLMPGVQGRGIRDMLNPGTAYDDRILGHDPQPSSMDDFIVTDEDSGGVHLNSSIPNRAFAVASRAVPGSSFSTAGQVWYDVITRRLEYGQRCSFGHFAEMTLQSATAVYGNASDVFQAVVAGWDAVKVTPRLNEPPR